ncbi:MAG: type II toxin-antitoxin system RelE/ParE family toxin [Acidobacteriota bacterium]|nr:type II toxin-antitoxin system RelE/ParE family toxin [Acidobacteriota bacterium]MDH3522034.1 type II toxin-antitoxin system RelE/ParE family toxin [Acidobacteriota bacterium]
MRVRWTRRALRALDGIAAYIAQDSPAAARRVVSRLEDSVGQLALHPSRGRVGRVAGTRELVVSETPFIVPYRVRGDSVEVLAVLHAARRWPEEFTR